MITDQEKRELLNDFETRTYVDYNGICRWCSNNSVPPEDILAVFRDFLKITNTTYERSLAVRAVELENKLREYAEANRGRNLSSEERAEMTAAFGEGSNVVNVITGDRYTL